MKNKSFSKLTHLFELLIQQRRWVIAVVMILTAAMAWMAAHVEVKTVFSDLLPKNHPYVAVNQKFKATFGGSNMVSIMLETEQGDIFDPKVLAKVQKVTVGLQQVDSIDTYQIVSIASKKVKEVRASTEGVESRPIMWPDLPKTPEQIATLSILITDAYADPRFYPGVAEITGYHTQQILCVPIKNRRGEILGVLELLNKRTGAFTPEDEEVLSLLATQIGIAMANAQLYDGLRTSLDRLSRLMKIGAAISSELDLDALLRTISQTTSHLLQAERSTVFVVDSAKNELWSRVAEGLGNKEIRIPLSAGIAGRVATTGNPVRISDAYRDLCFIRQKLEL